MIGKKFPPTGSSYDPFGLGQSSTDYYHSTPSQTGFIVDTTVPSWASQNRYPAGTIPMSLRELTPAEKLDKAKVVHDEHQKALKRKLKGPKRSRWG